jgi:gliding motility-associated-like protein
MLNHLKKAYFVIPEKGCRILAGSLLRMIKNLIKPLLLALHLLAFCNAFAQAPNIKYTSPQNYTVNTSIALLKPTNTGGVVPGGTVGPLSVFAGNGTFGSVDGPGATANFHYPTGLACDKAGNVYVADYWNNKIRKITPAGIVSTVAGSGAQGRADGPAATASFYEPTTLDIDKAGNIIVCDMSNSSIRKIGTDGIVSTIAGNGFPGFADGTGTAAQFDNPTGLKVDASGNIIVADKSSNLIRKITPDGVVTTFAGDGLKRTANGTGTAASFNAPQNIAIDKAGNLFVAEYTASLIRKITPNGEVTTFAGNGVAASVDGQGTNASFNWPIDITIDDAGNLIVADYEGKSIRMISPAGKVTTLISAAANLTPQAIALDKFRNLFIADVLISQIKTAKIYGYTIDKDLPVGLVFNDLTGEISGAPTEVSPATDYLITAYNASGSNSTTVNIAVKTNALPPIAQAPNITYTTPQDYKINYTITPLAPKNTGGNVPLGEYGTVSTFAGTGQYGYTDGSANIASFKIPAGMVIDNDNNVYVADFGNQVIRKITPQGLVSTFAGNGSGGRDNGTGTQASFYGPSGLAIDQSGILYVTEQTGQDVRKINIAAQVSLLAGSGFLGKANGNGNAASFNSPVGAAFGPDHNLYVSDLNNYLIRKITPAGDVSTFAGNGVAASTNGTLLQSSFGSPQGLAFDSKGNLYVCDDYSYTIRKIATDGTVTTFAGNGNNISKDGVGTSAGFTYPDHLVFDNNDDLFVSDANLIRKITPQGVVTTIAGSVSSGFVDGVGTDARFYNASGLAFDRNGFLFVGEVSNHLIRKITLTGYTINKPLPPGLVFDATTGIISGTPTALAPAEDYTITARNKNGISSTAVRIGVTGVTTPPATLPPAISYQTPQIYTVNAAIVPLEPKNTGGEVPAGQSGVVTTFAGLSYNDGKTDGPLNVATFQFPRSLVFDKAGNMFVVEHRNRLIRKISTGGIVSTFAGSGINATVDGLGTAASFEIPSALTIDNADNLYVTDGESKTIRKISPAGQVTTFAGNGKGNFLDGKGLNASFGSPAEIITMADGNMYVIDAFNDAIRKITPGGDVTTLAGNGYSYSGFKDGNGASAQLFQPGWLTEDGDGNILFTDQMGTALRKVTPTGDVTTIGTIGTGSLSMIKSIYGFVKDQAGNIYINDGEQRQVFKLDRKGEITLVAGSGLIGVANGPLKEASFNTLSSINTDKAGNLYVADDFAGTIRKISLYGYSIDRPLPAGLTFDVTNGNISGTPTALSPATEYTITASNAGGSSSTKISIEIRDIPPPAGLPPVISYQTPQVYTANTAIAQLVPKNTGGAVPATTAGVVSTFAGTGEPGLNNGPGATATFNIVRTLVTTDAGDVIVIDDGNSVLRKITPAGIVSTFAGDGTNTDKDGLGTLAAFSAAIGITKGSDGNLYMAEPNGNTIRKITPTGEVTTFAGSSVAGYTDAKGTLARFNNPYYIAADKNGNIYVTDDHVIRKITQDGTVTTFAGNGTKGFADGQGTNARFNAPAQIIVTNDGGLLVVDGIDNTLRKITPDGLVSTIGILGQPGTFSDISSIYGLATDNAGNIYLSAGQQHKIFKLDTKGQLSLLTGTGQPTSGDGKLDEASITLPGGMAFDKQGNLYVAESEFNKVRKISLYGYTIDKPLPTGLVFDSTTGTISGTPTVASSATDYTVTAYNSNGGGSTKISLEVKPTAVPVLAPNIDYPTPQIYTINKPITILLPTNKGGEVQPGGYSIDKTLPAGLSFDVNTGAISGTPTGLSPATIYTISAKNAIGVSNAILNIKVTDGLAPVAPAPDISYLTPQTLPVNSTITPILPANKGGEVKKYSYGLLANFAGTGQPGRTDGPKAGAKFDGPAKVTIDAQGNFYITDFNNYSVRKINSAGITSTIAGAAGPGYTNGALGISQLQGPRGVVTDRAGNVYVADVYAVRKINAAGVTSTLAGGSVPGYIDGTGTAARFDGAVSLAIDGSDNLYVVDQGNVVIRKITPTGVVTTLAGNRNRGNTDGQGTAAAFNNPQDIILSNGALYVADYLNVRRVTTGGLVSTIAGNGVSKVLNGPALSAGFGNASALLINTAGDIYVLDIGNNAPNEGNAILRVIDKDNNVSTVDIIDGNGDKIYLVSPNSLTIDKTGLIYIASGGNYIQSLSFDRYTIDKALPAGLVFDTGTGIISGTPTVLSPPTNYTITAYNASGSSSTKINLEVVEQATTLSPPAIVYITPQKYFLNKPIAALSPGNSGGAVPANPYGQVSTLAGGNGSSSTNGTGAAAGFSLPSGIGADNAGNIYVTDFGSGAIRKITSGGVVTTIATLGQPSGLAADAQGNCYVSDFAENNIYKITAAGVKTVFAGSGLIGANDGLGAAASFNGPGGLALDAQGNLYVTDQINNKIRKITPDGLVTTLAGSGATGSNNGSALAATFNNPDGVTVDKAGNVYVADTKNNLIRKIAADGTVSTFAGNGAAGKTDGTGTATNFNYPTNLTIDALGNLYVADYKNNLIRKITPAGVVSTLAGSGATGSINGTFKAASFNGPIALIFDNTGNLFVNDFQNNLVRKLTLTGFSIDKTLPDGLTFDAATGTVSGTPTVIAPAVDYTVTAYNSAGSSSTVVTLEVTDQPSLVFSPIPTKITCDPDFNPGATSNNPVTYTSSNTVVATIINGQIHILTPGTSTITANSNGESLSQLLTVNAVPQPGITIGSTAPIPDCANVSIIVFTVQPTNQGNNPVYQWQVNKQNVGTNSLTYSSTTLVNGDEVTCTVTNNDVCPSPLSATSGPITVRDIISPISPAPTLTVSASVNNVYAGTTIVLTATPSNPAVIKSYEWFINDKPQGVNSTAFTGNNFKDKDVVSCVATVNNACNLPISDEVTINLLPPPTIRIPNTFTPNGDGINETWNIPDLAFYPKCVVRIFNRYGTELIESKGYSKAWDGTYSGKVLPAGVYYYIIDTRDGQPKLSGNVTILR